MCLQLGPMCYWDVSNNYRKVAKCVNSACTGVGTLTTVDSAGDVGQSTSITLGADGLPVIFMAALNVAGARGCHHHGEARSSASPPTRSNRLAS